MLRFLKQFLFGLLFLAIFGGVGFWIYNSTRPVLSCFDKIQNQGEEDVDCGAVCGNVCISLLGPMEVRSSHLFKIKEEAGGLIDYDTLFSVHNPEAHFGSSRVSYELAILDAQKDPLFTKTGQFYILPKQTKYIYEPALKTKSLAVFAEFKVTGVEWEQLSGIFSEDAKFVAKSKNYIVNDRPGIFSRVSGIMFNSSDLDFNRVDMVVVLFKNGQPIGAGRTDLRTFPAKTDRFFEVTWVSPIEPPDRIEVEANTNVFENSNFLRKYGTPEKFQQP